MSRLRTSDVVSGGAVPAVGALVAGSATPGGPCSGPVRPAARAEAFCRLETLVAEQGHVAWGNVGALQIGRARRVLVDGESSRRRAAEVTRTAARPKPTS